MAMSEHLPDHPDTPAGWLDWTTAQQSAAADPGRSAWVSANAGSGKTHVLTQRVIRLLLAGARPSSILCLTYTKAAASEMSNRVFERLGAWATLNDEELASRIERIEGARPDRIKLALARQLFARALETPGGLKIQTIHAFCEALLHQFPLEANVAGHFSVLDDRAASVLLADARRAMLTAASSEEDADLAEAFAYVLSVGDEFGLDTLLGEIVANRIAIANFVAVAGPTPEDALRRAFQIAENETEADLLAGFWPLAGLSDANLSLYIDIAREVGGSKAGEIADLLASAVKTADPAERIDLMEAALLKKDGDPKAMSTLATKKMLAAAPHLETAITEAIGHLVDCRDRLKRFRLFQATRAALTLATRLLGDYEDLKKERSLLDFEDLINRAAALLTKSQISAWIHYKLDQGIDHILVDEAQDTSPIQWQVIRSLSDDFFSGETSRPGTRTLFAVGDEKQSIYSFQGARPERFAAERTFTQKRVTASGGVFSGIRLPLSFRSTEDVLSAVDQVFSLAENARGLAAGGDDIIHRSNRSGHPGAVDLWEMIGTEAMLREDDWTAPFDSTPENAPPAILARRIAHHIGQLVADGTIIEDGKARRVRPGDILILVRKRDGFVNALTRLLKSPYNIPVAGADRLRLTSHIAIQDLMALGRFALLPEDDLSLAALLKSPLFNLGEADVFEICGLRAENQSAWSELKRRAASGDARLETVRDSLLTHIAAANRLSVHDFYAQVLAAHGGRRKFLARLGTEVSDILDEFLTFALDQEQNGLPGLQAFLSTLELEAPEVKREQDKGRDEVRIMTVHASKGLEAPIVFLVDGGSAAFSHSHLSKFRMIDTPDSAAPVPVWAATKDVGNSLTEEDGERAKAAAEEEYRRLLYVGMTRAADRLIVCGYRGIRQNPGIWHEMISNALAADDSRCRETEFIGPDGATWNGYSWRAAAPKRTFDRADEQQKAERTRDLPAALSRPLPPIKALPRPLSPSGTGSVIDAETGDAPVLSPLFGNRPAENHALEKGRIQHRLTQVLPGLEPSERRTAAIRYLERAAGNWDEEERDRTVEKILAVIDHPDIAAAFAASAQVEVSIMGTLSLNGRDYSVSGRIDRLAVDGDTVIIIDYKTNRVVPETVETVSPAYIAQLAIYREILAPLYPGKRFECALVYTEEAVIHVIPSGKLASALAELKTK
ncbi:double-strand break repair helicase AddA [Rhizobium sp. PAMB 3174]